MSALLAPCVAVAAAAAAATAALTCGDAAALAAAAPPTTLLAHATAAAFPLALLLLAMSTSFSSASCRTQRGGEKEKEGSSSSPKHAIMLPLPGARIKSSADDDSSSRQAPMVLLALLCLDQCVASFGGGASLRALTHAALGALVLALAGRHFWTHGGQDFILRVVGKKSPRPVSAAPVDKEARSSQSHPVVVAKTTTVQVDPTELLYDPVSPPSTPPPAPAAVVASGSSSAPAATTMPVMDQWPLIRPASARLSFLAPPCLTAAPAMHSLNVALESRVSIPSSPVATTELLAARTTPYVPDIMLPLPDLPPSSAASTASLVVPSAPAASTTTPLQSRLPSPVVEESARSAVSDRSERSAGHECSSGCKVASSSPLSDGGGNSSSGETSSTGGSPPTGSPPTGSPPTSSPLTGSPQTGGSPPSDSSCSTCSSSHNSHPHHSALPLHPSHHAHHSSSRALLRLKEKLHALDASHARAEQESSQKGMYMNFLAHELRNPLQVITANTDFLLEDADEAEKAASLDGGSSSSGQQLLTADQRELISSVNTSAELMLSIVNDVLTMSALQSGRMSFESLPCDLHGIAHSILHIVRSQAAQKGLTLRLDISESVPRFVVSDPTRLHQLLLNLISNSIKFTAEGGVTLSVRMASPPPVEEVEREDKALLQSTSATPSESPALPKRKISRSSAAIGLLPVEGSPSVGRRSLLRKNTLSSRQSSDSQLLLVPSSSHLHSNETSPSAAGVPPSLSPSPALSEPSSASGSGSDSESVNGGGSGNSSSSSSNSRVWIELSISDTGCGISSDALPKLFTPFTQASASTNRQYGGSGLGLSIVSQIVKLMQGKIHVTSELGKGSIFSTKLRLEVCDEETLAREIHGGGALASSSSSTSASVGSKTPNLQLMAEANQGRIQERMDEANAALAAAAAAAMPAPVSVPGETASSTGTDVAASADSAAAGAHLVAPVPCTPFVGAEQLSSTSTTPCTPNVTSPATLAEFSRSPLPPRYHLSDAAQNIQSVGSGGGATTMNTPCTPASPACTTASSTPPTATTTTMATERILVVDDQDVNCKLLKRMMSSLGFIVDVAHDGVEALDLVKEHLIVSKESSPTGGGGMSPQCAYLVAFLDLHMPRLDGWGCCSAIRHDLGLRSLPLVALTAEAVDSERARAGGFDTVLTKPFRKPTLVQVLEPLLEAKRQASLLQAANASATTTAQTTPKVEEEAKTTPTPAGTAACTTPPQIVQLDAEVAPMHQRSSSLTSSVTFSSPGHDGGSDSSAQSTPSPLGTQRGLQAGSSCTSSKASSPFVLTRSPLVALNTLSPSPLTPLSVGADTPAVPPLPLSPRATDAARANCALFALMHASSVEAARSPGRAVLPPHRGSPRLLSVNPEAPERSASPSSFVRSIGSGTRALGMGALNRESAEHQLSPLLGPMSGRSDASSLAPSPPLRPSSRQLAQDVPSCMDTLTLPGPQQPQQVLPECVPSSHRRISLGRSEIPMHSGGTRLSDTPPKMVARALDSIVPPAGGAHQATSAHSNAVSRLRGGGANSPLSLQNSPRTLSRQLVLEPSTYAPLRRKMAQNEAAAAAAAAAGQTFPFVRSGLSKSVSMGQDQFIGAHHLVADSSANSALIPPLHPTASASCSPRLPSPSPTASVTSSLSSNGGPSQSSSPRNCSFTLGGCSVSPSPSGSTAGPSSSSSPTQFGGSLSASPAPSDLSRSGEGGIGAIRGSLVSRDFSGNRSADGSLSDASSRRHHHHHHAHSHHHPSHERGHRLSVPSFSTRRVASDGVTELLLRGRAHKRHSRSSSDSSVSPAPTRASCASRGHVEPRSAQSRREVLRAKHAAFKVSQLCKARELVTLLPTTCTASPASSSGSEGTPSPVHLQAPPCTPFSPEQPSAPGATMSAQQHPTWLTAVEPVLSAASAAKEAYARPFPLSVFRGAANDAVPPPPSSASSSSSSREGSSAEENIAAPRTQSAQPRV